MRTNKKVDAMALSCSAIDAKPVDYDWSANNGDDAWQSFEVAQCPKCGDVVVSRYGECPQCGKQLLCDAGPMMNYFYPIEAMGGCEQAAAKLGVCSLCVVELENGDTGIALTGGGMDMTWEICDAFVRLGYYPPAHFCDLPQMAGRGTSKEDRLLIAICIESLRIAASWHTSAISRLREAYTRKAKP